MSTSPTGYHHGDLRAALITAAVESLESGEQFSLRGVARRAGVSHAAPYRHFADREALESAVAISGFVDLRAALGDAARTEHASVRERITALASTYVTFALRHPTVFRLMFGHECDPEDSDRVRAAAELRDFLHSVVTSDLPGRDTAALATALWSTAHGLAFLHLDGKFRPEPLEDVIDRVRSAFAALLTLTPDPANTASSRESSAPADQQESEFTHGRTDPPRRHERRALR